MNRKELLLTLELFQEGKALISAIEEIRDKHARNIVEEDVTTITYEALLAAFELARRQKHTFPPEINILLETAATILAHNTHDPDDDTYIDLPTEH